MIAAGADGRSPAEDVPFVLRLVVQSKLSGSPEGLSTEGGELYDAIRMHLPDSVSNNLNETCPACQADVSFQDITSAVCTNNHHWRQYRRAFWVH